MFRRLHRDYLSLTRGERRGMRILSLGVIFGIAFRASIPLMVSHVEEDLTLAEKDFISFQDSILAQGAVTSGGPSFHRRASIHAENMMYGGPSSHASIIDPEETSILPEPFPFDPNTASGPDLARLGIPDWTVRILINYRNAGGEFRRDSDLLRIYGLNPEVFTHLKEYILIDTARFQTRKSSAGFRNLSPGAGMDFPGDTSVGLRDFELNQADSLQLLSVRHIGPVYASRIIRYRNLLGGFYSHEQLMEVYGFSLLQYQEIMQSSYLDTGLLRKLDLNSVNAGDLAIHPYIDWYQAKSIIYFREHLGTYENEDELLENRILPDSVFTRIRPYLYVGH